MMLAERTSNIFKQMQASNQHNHRWRRSRIFSRNAIRNQLTIVHWKWPQSKVKARFTSQWPNGFLAGAMTAVEHYAKFQSNTFRGLLEEVQLEEVQEHEACLSPLSWPPAMASVSEFASVSSPPPLQSPLPTQPLVPFGAACGPPPSRLPPASSPLPIPILLCGHLSHDLDLEQPDHHYYHNHHHLELEQLQLSAVRVAKLPNSTTIATAQSHGSARRCLEGGSWKNHGSPLFWCQNWNRLEKALKLSNELIFKCRWFSIEMFRWRT